MLSNASVKKTEETRIFMEIKTLYWFKNNGSHSVTVGSMTYRFTRKSYKNYKV